MIIADRKPLEELQEMIKEMDNIMLVGCKGCVTVCNVGGLKEVEILASTLRIARKKEGRPLQIEERMLERQCDPEYVEQLRDSYDQFDGVLSMACGVGLCGHCQFGPEFVCKDGPIFPYSRVARFFGVRRL